jgi:hypothetical protein
MISTTLTKKAFQLSLIVALGSYFIQVKETIFFKKIESLFLLDTTPTIFVDLE